MISSLRAASRVPIAVQRGQQRRKFGALAVPFLEIPNILPFTPAYATTIVLLSLGLRAGITLPLSIWQRKRTYRLEHHVKPALDVWAIENKDKCRRDCKAAGMSYEAYTKEWTRMYKSQRRALAKAHKCSVLPTIITPPLIGIPIFIIVSNTIRVASSVALTEPEKWSLATETLFDYPSLAIPATDPTVALLIGASFLINTEINSNLRKKLLEIRTPSSPTNVDSEQKDVSQTPQENNTRMDMSVHEKGVTILLRSLSLGMSWFALSIPLSLALYWLTSGVFSVGQTTILGLMSNRDAKNHVKNDIERLRDIRIQEYRRFEEKKKYAKLRR
ncbi:hypothetical protein E3Q16_03030 [Wallemia mellicola]|uniref:Membrane insertase YidC/Oxa/ALB C-terminal domain-containing protein n=1 Tax=Wallemia mellicola TaxID=1708541 RepID=A0AB38MS64_9BASI|nr:hypothetical protein E3Q24_02897 [Wallemia mellicola]TIC03426.1 hypothetical protein E3Q16_03030 [Wallemia mellicola]TIC60968.1 hypothetical protein E3Q03_02900 [Wallemia mellicola]TIC63545.1 hypothetical protein E3Q02_02996 [Wallemia mellicola]